MVWHMTSDSTLDNCTTPAKQDRNRGLGATLRQLRREARATQADIAEALGLERTSICNIENGAQAMTIEKLHDFGARCGVDVVVSFRPRKRGGPAKVEVVLAEGVGQ